MRIFILAFVCLALSSCKDKQPEIYTASSVAITGYDPVAYFTENKPVKGNPKYSFEWKGSSWLFSSEQNRDSFSLNPEKYAPQYGGYCAYGCSRGKKVATDPDAWTIVDGKLYLNKSPQVKELWLKEQKQRIEMADKNWSAIKGE